MCPLLAKGAPIVASRGGEAATRRGGVGCGPAVDVELDADDADIEAVLDDEILDQDVVVPCPRRAP